MEVCLEQGDKEQKDLIMSLHHAKTDKFMELISNGTLQLRPGVKSLIGAAHDDEFICVLKTCSESACIAAAFAQRGMAQRSSELPLRVVGKLAL